MKKENRMEKVRLKDILKKPISGEWGQDGDGVKVLRTTNFTNQGKLNLSNVVLRNIDSEKILKKKLIKGDTIIEKSGGSPTQPVGRVVYFDEDELYLCNNFTSILRPTKEIDSKYFFWSMFTNHLTGKTLKFQNKTTGIINLKLDNYINDIQIPLPPLDAQKRIATLLDTADSLRQKDKALLQKYDALAQSLFLELFGDPVRNEKGWELNSTITYCDCIVPGRDKPKSFTGDIPWVTTNDLNHLGFTKISKANIGLNKNEILEVRAKLIPNGSVILTCVGDLGKISINTQEMIINQQLHAFQCSEKINNIFLMYSLSFQTSYMNKMASSTTVPYMNKTVVNSIPTICPPIELQNQFAEQIQLIEKQKELVQENLKKSEALFMGLLGESFK